MPEEEERKSAQKRLRVTHFSSEALCGVNP
jgi:hypothetical protein